VLGCARTWPHRPEGALLLRLTATRPCSAACFRVCLQLPELPCGHSTGHAGPHCQKPGAVQWPHECGACMVAPRVRGVHGGPTSAGRGAVGPQARIGAVSPTQVRECVRTQFVPLELCSHEYLWSAALAWERGLRGPAQAKPRQSRSLHAAQATGDVPDNFDEEP